MLLFRLRKTSARKLHSARVSLYPMQCFIIAYIRFLESFAFFSFNELHNIDTVHLINHYNRLSLLFVLNGCI